ncbi:MAG: ComEA family DNA-binding protein [bacterium]|jgi:competence ComEA-like helix-hairpin-helix protein
MQRNELLLTFLLAALVVIGSIYETLRGGSKTAQVIVTHSDSTPFDVPAEMPGARTTLPVPRTPLPPVPLHASPDIVLNFLNQATKAQLLEISGIGEAYASRILEARQMRGSFVSLDQVVMVQGIGEKTLQKIREHVQRLQNAPAMNPAQALPDMSPRLHIPVQNQPPVQHAPTLFGGQVSQPMSLNRAGKAELMQINGIGGKLADTILLERQRLGRFGNWQDVDGIPGVGEARLKLLQEHFVLP